MQKRGEATNDVNAAGSSGSIRAVQERPLLRALDDSSRRARRAVIETTLRPESQRGFSGDEALARPRVEATGSARLLRRSLRRSRLSRAPRLQAGATRKASAEEQPPVYVISKVGRASVDALRRGFSYFRVPAYPAYAPGIAHARLRRSRRYR